jgi:hypothetical protein
VFQFVAHAATAKVYCDLHLDLRKPLQDAGIRKFAGLSKAGFSRNLDGEDRCEESSLKIRTWRSIPNLGYLVLDLSDLSVLGPHWRYTRYGPYGFVMV